MYCCRGLISFRPCIVEFSLLFVGLNTTGPPGVVWVLTDCVSGFFWPGFYRVRARREWFGFGMPGGVGIRYVMDWSSGATGGLEFGTYQVKWCVLSGRADWNSFRTGGSEIGTMQIGCCRGICRRRSFRTMGRDSFRTMGRVTRRGKAEEFKPGTGCENSDTFLDFSVTKGGVYYYPNLGIGLHSDSSLPYLQMKSDKTSGNLETYRKWI